MKTKTEALHTPGPWVVGATGHGMPSIWHGKSAVCFLGRNDENGDAQPFNKHKANACLIAEAPAMLKELIRCRDGYYCVGTDSNNDCCGVTFTCAPCRRRAELTKIIDKALGK